MQKKVLAGIDIGGTKTAIVLSVEPPAVLGRVEFPTRPSKGPQAAITNIKKSIDDLLAAQGFDRSALLRLGVSCGGQAASRSFHRGWSAVRAAGTPTALSKRHW